MPTTPLRDDLIDDFFAFAPGSALEEEEDDQELQPSLIDDFFAFAPGAKKEEAPYVPPMAVSHGPGVTPWAALPPAPASAVAVGPPPQAPPPQAAQTALPPPEANFPGADAIRRKVAAAVPSMLSPEAALGAGNTQPIPGGLPAGQVPDAPPGDPWVMSGIQNAAVNAGRAYQEGLVGQLGGAGAGAEWFGRTLAETPLPGAIEYLRPLLAAPGGYIEGAGATLSQMATDQQQGGEQPPPRQAPVGPIGRSGFRTLRPGQSEWEVGNLDPITGGSRTGVEDPEAVRASFIDRAPVGAGPGGQDPLSPYSIALGVVQNLPQLQIMRLAGLAANTGRVAGAVGGGARAVEKAAPYVPMMASAVGDNLKAGDSEDVALLRGLAEVIPEMIVRMPGVEDLGGERQVFETSKAAAKYVAKMAGGESIEEAVTALMNLAIDAGMTPDKLKAELARDGGMARVKETLFSMAVAAFPGGLSAARNTSVLKGAKEARQAFNADYQAELRAEKEARAEQAPPATEPPAPEAPPAGETPGDMPAGNWGPVDLGPNPPVGPVETPPPAAPAAPGGPIEPVPGPTVAPEPIVPPAAPQDVAPEPDGPLALPPAEPTMEPPTQPVEDLEESKTGLPNIRAYDQASDSRLPVQARAELRGLDQLRQQFGDAAVDAALPAIGEAIVKETDELGGRPYHIEGGEFVFEFEDEVQAQTVLDKLKDVTKTLSVEVPAQDGSVHTVSGFTLKAGTGATIDEAERKLPRRRPTTAPKPLTTAKVREAPVAEPATAEPAPAATEPAVETPPPVAPEPVAAAPAPEAPATGRPKLVDVVVDPATMRTEIRRSDDLQAPLKSVFVPISKKEWEKAKKANEIPAGLPGYATLDEVVEKHPNADESYYLEVPIKPGQKMRVTGTGVTLDAPVKRGMKAGEKIRMIPGVEFVAAKNRVAAAPAPAEPKPEPKAEPKATKVAPSPAIGTTQKKKVDKSTAPEPDKDSVYDPVAIRNEVGADPTVAIGVAEADPAIARRPNVPYRSVWAVVDSDSLETSHVVVGPESDQFSLEPNPTFPGEIQNRDVSADDSRTRVLGMSKDYDTVTTTGSSPKLGEGPPVVVAMRAKDGKVRLFVLGGNHRVMALKVAFAQGARSTPYREALAAVLKKRLGSKGAQKAATIKNPVLVRVLVTDPGTTGVSLRQVAEDMNSSGVSVLPLPQRAIQIAEKLPDSAFDELQINEKGEITQSANPALVREVMAAVPDSDRGTLKTTSGDLNPEGIKFLQAVIVARAYGDPSLVDAIYASQKENVKVLAGALVIAAPKMAKLRGLVDSGNVHPEFDVGAAISQAVQIIQEKRADGVDPHLWAKSETLSPMSVLVEELTSPEFVRSQARSAAALGAIYDDAVHPDNDPKQASFLSPQIPPTTTIIRDAFNKVRAETVGGPEVTTPVDPEKPPSTKPKKKGGRKKTAGDVQQKRSIRDQIDERVRDAASADAKTHPPEVKKLYLQLAHLMHPDKAADKADELRRTEFMKALNNAYDNNDLGAMQSLQQQWLKGAPVPQGVGGPKGGKWGPKAPPPQPTPPPPSQPTGQAQPGAPPPDVPIDESHEPDRLVDTMGKHYGMRFPELVELARELARAFANGSVRIRFRHLGATINGLFRDNGRGDIVINKSLLGNWAQLVRTTAHEIGHLVDWIPGDSPLLKRGANNVLGRVAALRKYLKWAIDELPTSQSKVLTQDERKKLRAKAVKNVVQQHGRPRRNKDGTDSKRLYIDHLTPAEQKRLIVNEYRALLKAEYATRRLISRRTVMRELLNLTAAWRPWTQGVDRGYDDYRGSGEELFADFISVLLNDPDMLKTFAPTTASLFFNYIDNRPEFKEAYGRLNDLFRQGIDSVMADRIHRVEQENVRGVQAILDKLKAASERRKESLRRALAKATIDARTALYELRGRAREAGPKAKYRFETAMRSLRELYYTATRVQSLVFEHALTVLEPMVESGHFKDRDDASRALSIYLSLRDRATSVKPDVLVKDPVTGAVALKQADPNLTAASGGMFGDEAQETLDKWLASMPAERVAALKAGQKAFWELRKQYALRDLAMSGAVDDAMIDQFFANENYARREVLLMHNFAARAAGEDPNLKGVSASLTEEELATFGPLSSITHARDGSLNEAGDALLNTLMNDFAIMRWASRNRAVLNTLDALRSIYAAGPAAEGEEVRLAPVKHVLGRVFFKAPAESSPYGMVYVWEQGQRVAYWVKKDVADAINYTPQEAGRLLETVQDISALPRALLVTHFPGWALWNARRDTKATGYNAMLFYDPETNRTGARRWLQEVLLTPWIAQAYLAKGRTEIAVAGAKGWWRFYHQERARGHSFRDSMILAYARAGVEAVTPGEARAMKAGAVVPRGDRAYETKDLTPDRAYQVLAARAGLDAAQMEQHVTRPIYRFLWDLFKGALSAAGQISERGGKAGAFEMLEDFRPDLSVSQRADLVRTRLSTPNPFDRGTAHGITNTVFMFSNMGFQGIRQSVTAVRDSPSTVLARYALGILPSATTTILAVKGLLWNLEAFGGGDDDDTPEAQEEVFRQYVAGERKDFMHAIATNPAWWRRVPLIDVTLYQIVPLGVTGDGKAVYARLPLPHTAQMVHQLVWNFSEASPLEWPMALIRSAASQNPVNPGSLTPFLENFVWFGQFLEGKNPTRFYEGRNVLTDQEMNVHGVKDKMRVWGKLGVAMAENLGVRNFYMPPVAESESIPEWMQRAASVMLRPNMNRLIKVSDQGLADRSNMADKAIDAKRNSRGMRIKDYLADAIKEDDSLTRKTKDRAFREFRDYMNEHYAADVEELEFNWSDDSQRQSFDRHYINVGEKVAKARFKKKGD